MQTYSHFLNHDFVTSVGTEIDSGQIQHDENLTTHKESNNMKVNMPSQVEALKEKYRVMCCTLKFILESIPW